MSIAALTYEEVVKEKESLEIKLRETETAYENRIEAMKTTHAEEIEAMKTAHAEEIENLEDEEHPELRAKIAVLKKKLAAAEDKTDTLNMALRMAYREFQQKLSTPTLQAKDKELADSKAAVKELQKKMENKKRKYELESANLEKELDDTQEENGELHSEIERLRQASMDTSQLNKELKKAQREVRKLQSQYETERQARITAQDDLDETKRTIYSLEHKCEELMRV